ncbi:MAG: dihydropteroate synthase [Chloroflexota bacterium]|nr:dihydropteroate synthase [Chloroflexota bacterium]
MAIVNLTPDSFSGDGLAYHADAAVESGLKAVQAGADVIDLGGESTAYWREGYEPVSVEEELSRVLPAIERLQRLTEAPISIDTRKPEVARRALEAGARWLNDVEGVWDDGTMAALAAEYRAAFVLMHNRRQEGFTDVVGEVRDVLAAAAERALAAGLPRELLVLDPGFGFGKTAENNLELLRRLSELRQLGFPLLVGTSRKRFLGHILGTPPEDRLEGTEASVAIAIAHGADAVRVHDVEPIVRIVRVSDAIVRGGDAT